LYGFDCLIRNHFSNIYKRKLGTVANTQYIQEIKQILAAARQNAYTAVNAAMVEAYWQIGKRIVLQEQQGEKRAAYGEQVLKELSKELTHEFGKGFSYPNLRNFRQFYLTFPDEQICYTLCSKLTWSHNRLIMRVEDVEGRHYYLKEAAEQGWSVRTLDRNIQTFYYQRLLSSQRNEQLLQHGNLPEKANLNDFIKDPYVFEFLNIPQPITATEKEIETALIENLQQFLLELGKGFCFVGRQFRISSETEHYFIDLVFYNYMLKGFVLIDLKAGKLTHQDIGQMDMYRRMFDDLKKLEGDSPTVGIILCTEKSETVVKYSVMSDSSHLFATKYKLYLPTEAELIAEIEREKLKLNILNNE
jgi:predicted nuclease of restriction endonuclease-like (RecB) superfamily